MNSPKVKRLRGLKRLGRFAKLLYLAFKGSKWTEPTPPRPQPEPLKPVLGIHPQWLARMERMLRREMIERLYKASFN